MNLLTKLKNFVIAFIRGPFRLSEDQLPEEMKPERIQFWEDMNSARWVNLGNALQGVITVANSRAAGALAKHLSEELGQYNYSPDSITTDGNDVNVLLSTAGKVTEPDYAASVLIDLTI